MRAILLALLAAAALAAPPADAQGSDRYTALRLRAGPSTETAVLARMPRGGRVGVGACVAGWCEATYAGVAGYASEAYLSPSPPAYEAPRAGSGRGYTNSRGEWVPSPRYSPSGPPPGATAQCRDGTYSFSRSRRGTCSHHGGVARWL